jgi:hypothetical protein
MVPGSFSFERRFDRTCSAHPVHRILVEARIDQRLAQKVDGLVAVFGQELTETPTESVPGVKGEAGRQGIARFGETAAVHLARAFLEAAVIRLTTPRLSGASSEVPPGTGFPAR